MAHEVHVSAEPSLQEIQILLMSAPSFVLGAYEVGKSHLLQRRTSLATWKSHHARGFIFLSDIA